MKSRRWLIVIGTLLTAGLLALGAGATALGQGGVDLAGVVEGDGAQREAALLARPAKTMNYQGYLTDGSGGPLNGNYDMVFSLWDEEAAGAGAQEWGDETHSGVSVSNGLFSVVLGEILPIDPYTVFEEQLYLEISVDGTTLPRQPLRAVPYAMGLTAGTRMIGATASGSDYGLWVENTNGPGLYVNGNTTYGIFNHDVTRSDDGYAGPDTYLWAPTLNTVLSAASNAHLVYQFGHVEIDADGNGTVWASVPLPMERPYGRDYLLRGARVFYRVDGGANVYNAVITGINFTNGAQLTIGSNGDDHTGTTFGYFDITATQNYTVSFDMAPTAVNLVIDMDAVGDTVYLYGVRLTLDSTY
jgi:hypothetical protein